MDDVVYEPEISWIPNVHKEAETSVSAQDTNIPTIPEGLKQYKHSSQPIEICSNNHMRVTCQYIYQPTELTIVFFLLNQSAHALTDIQLITKLPSNLKAISAPVDFQNKKIESMTSCSHVISIVYNSPALHMVLSGNVVYRDSANTEKKIFVNHVLPMSTLIRPLNIDVKDFGSSWQERSLYTKKEEIDVKINDVNKFIQRLQEKNCCYPVEVIGE